MRQVSFAARPTLKGEAGVMLGEALTHDFCSPLQVSKNRAVLGFVCSQACMGKLGASGRRRCYSASTQTRPHPCSAQRSLSTCDGSSRCYRRGSLTCTTTAGHRSATAGPTSRGRPLSVLVYEPIRLTRIGIYAMLQDRLLGLWGHPEQPRADVEQAAAIAGAMALVAKFRLLSILWVEDNAVVVRTW